MKKTIGLRKRWLRNTVGAIAILGLVFALLVTGVYAYSRYSRMKDDLRQRAVATTEYFNAYQNQTYEEFYSACITYAETFTDRDAVQLQLLDDNGVVVASSQYSWVGSTVSAEELAKADAYVGFDPTAGERAVIISSSVTYNSEIVGVFRYVASTEQTDMRILWVGLCVLLCLMAMLCVIVMVNSLYIQSVLNRITDISEKAKRIAGGAYGIQIQTKFNDEIGQLADNINELSSKVSQNEKMQAEFISSLSHELRTPLTAITGWSETLIGDENLDAETQRGMKIILREAKRLTEMVVYLLDFTRIQDGQMTLNVEVTDIRGEFEDTVFMYGGRLAQEGITLEYLDTDEEIPEVTCDAKRMRQVFLNVLDNAAKHGGDGKQIEASIAYEKKYVVIRIRDYGPGIPEDEIPLVKKKFYKGSSKARGTGIGLAVCEEIVQMHGGKLILSNAEGGGTLVTILLPANQ